MKPYRGPRVRPAETGPAPDRPSPPGPGPVATPVTEPGAGAEAEMHDTGEPATSEGTPPGAVADPAGAWADPPPPVADPAAEVLAWLRGEFDDVNANLRGLAQRLGRQEDAILRITGSQEEELNSSLAELEGCSAQLRNEAAVLRDTRTQLAVSLPGLVAEAVQSAVAGTVDTAVAELRAAVAQLGAALSEALPAAVADALAPPLARTDGAGPPLPGGGDSELVSRLHQAQAEAVERFAVVADEAVRQAVERWLVPAVTSAAAPGANEVPTTEPARPDAEIAPLPGAREAPDRAREAGGPPAPSPIPELATGPPAHDLGAAPERTTADGAEARQPAPETETEAPPPTTAEGDGGDARREGAFACVLPGVSVGPTLAIGVSVALGRARLRRRRRRQAGVPTPGLFRHDPFAGEVSRRLERFALGRQNMAWSPTAAGAGDETSPIPAEAWPRGLVAAAERHGQEVTVDLGAGLLALVGPDAPDAARALVTTFLATHGPGSGRVIATGDVMPPGPPFPGLERADDLATALGRLEAGIVADDGPPPATPVGADGGGGAEPTLVVLVTPAVPPDQVGRLVDLTRPGHRGGAAVLVVGEALPGAAVVTLGPGGDVRDVAPPEAAPDLVGSRMFGLGLGPTSELLDLFAAARTDENMAPAVAVAAGGELFPALARPGPASIKVRVLGPYRIDVGSKEIRSGLRAKARELLAFYLLHPEGTTLDQATEALWPEADPGRGSEWFWTALGNLRSLLRKATGTRALKVIERDGDRYRIEPVFDVDLWRFQAALPPPGAGPGDPEWAPALQATADIYSGELLAGVDWAWAEAPREDLRRRAVDVLVSLAATSLVAGDVRTALDTLSHAVEVDPLAEQLYRRIMRLHAKQFRPDEVEATFRRLKAKLGELGLNPTAESEQLVRELVRQG